MTPFHKLVSEMRQAQQKWDQFCDNAYAETADDVTEEKARDLFVSRNRIEKLVDEHLKALGLP